MNDSTKPSSSLPHWLLAASIILSLAALLAAAGLWFESGHWMNQQMQWQVAQSGNQQTLSGQVESLQSDNHQNRAMIDTLMRDIGQSKQQVTLGQVAYLVNLANLQLSMNDDSAAALKLLETAQHKLSAIDNHASITLKRALALNISQLKATPSLNLNQTISDIRTLSDAVGRASFVPKPASTHNVNTRQPLQIHPTWIQILKMHLSNLGNLITIRHYGSQLTPLIEPEQQRLLKLLIQTHLSTAQYAVIRHDATLYQQQLAQIKQWIESFYFTSSSQQQLLKQVHQLQSIQLNPTNIDLTETMTLLNNQINRITQNTPDQPAKPAHKQRTKPGLGVTV